MKKVRDLRNKYFNWMYQTAVGDSRRSYRELLLYLDDMEFTYKMRMDVNRYKDGVQLRYRFGYEFNIPDSVIEEELDNRPCSVLEMMLALCIRCEEHILNEPELGDRTSVWFMEMLESLDLEDMDDETFNEAIVEDVIFSMLNRKYDRSGKGGLFTCQRCPHDMRRFELWYQAMWHFNETLNYR